MGINIKPFKQKVPKMAAGGVVRADGSVAPTVVAGIPQGPKDDEEKKDKDSPGADFPEALQKAVGGEEEAPGLEELLGLQQGGVVKAQPGGTPVVLGEGGQD